MMNRAISKSVAIATLAALALFGGCKKHDENTQNGPGTQAAEAKAIGGAGPAALSGARCVAHHAPKELCFMCDARLRDKGRLWCEEHNRYEDRCFICHPELQDKTRMWCQEHSLYEDECLLCHPELRGKTTGPTASQPVLMCAEHGVPEAECAVCKPELAAQLQPGQGMKVRLPSTNSMGIIGVKVAVPQSGTIAEAIECVAELSFNQNKLAQIAAPVSGIVQAVDVDLGSLVEENQTVARIWSASIAESVARAVLSHQTLERERKLREQRVTSEQSLQEAEAAHRAACQHLRTLGFTEEQIDELGKKPQEQVLMEVQAPFAGEIVERMAVRGALVETGRALFTVVDHSTMWAMLQVPESALGRVKRGQPVELQLGSLPEKTFRGKLTWVAQGVDERTRMARARAEFANPEGLLKDKMFARARILTRQAEGAVLVPVSAIQRLQGKPFVFVKQGEDLFESRSVALGATANGMQEVLAGLKQADEVAVTHAFAIKSAMLISRLGAGCAGD